MKRSCTGMSAEGDGSADIPLHLARKAIPGATIDVMCDQRYAPTPYLSPGPVYTRTDKSAYTLVYKKAKEAPRW